jgi:hypothetical protein
LFENTDDAFQIIDPLYDKLGLIQDFKFVEVNSTYEKHTGFKGEYLTIKTLHCVDLKNGLTPYITRNEPTFAI